MSMVINNPVEPVRTLNIYNQNTTQIHKSLFRIASGVRINSAADDASIFSITERMRDRIRALDQANRNVQNDNSLLKVAEGAIANSIEIVQTLREKAINSANDHNTDEDRATIQQEAVGLLQQIDDNSRITFNGIKLLDGTQADSGLSFHIGGEENFSVTLRLENMSSEALGLNELDLSTREGAQRALGVDNGDGTYSHSVTDSNGNKIYGLLDTALNKLLEQQTTLGAMEARLGFTRDNIITASTNIQAAESTFRDTDMAREMPNYAKWNALWKASQLMLAQQNQNAGAVNSLLAPVQSTSRSG